MNEILGQILKQGQIFREVLLTSLNMAPNCSGVPVPPAVLPLLVAMELVRVGGEWGGHQPHHQGGQSTVLVNSVVCS